MELTGKVLVTGSAGRVGQAVVKALGPAQVRGFDLVPTPGLEDAIVGTLTDRSHLSRAVQGVHTIVHLAATPDDDDDFMSTLLPNNIAGVYNLFEEARTAGVRRLIVASSGQVVWYQRLRGPFPIRTDTEPTPRYWYAATKMFLEAIGRAFSEAHGLSVIVARLGWCPRTLAQVEEIHADPKAQDVYLSPNDAGRFFACAVNAPQDLKFGVFYAASKPVRSCPFDMEPAKKLLGFEPTEQWPQGIEIIR